MIPTNSQLEEMVRSLRAEVADLRREVARMKCRLGDVLDVANDAVQLAGGDHAEEAMKELERVLNS